MNMTDTVDNVETHVVIHFKNGKTYELPMKGIDGQDLDTYCTSIRVSEKLYESSASNIVGNVCGNSMDLELMSYDKLLIPSNKDSVYYGYMNNTAYIDIWCTVPVDNAKVYMGRYFVDAWEGATSASDAYKISISCSDLLTKVKNISLENIRLVNKMKFNKFLKLIVAKLNKELPEESQILIKDDYLNIFKNSSYSWDMEYNNMDRSTFESLLNNIALCTASYIWIDRNRYLRTDHLLDDSLTEAVAHLDGSKNIFEYNLETSDIDSYSGVKISYVNSVKYKDKQLLSLENVSLSKGSNKLLDQKLDDDNVFDIHTIKFTDDDNRVDCKNFDFYKDSIDLYINSTMDTKCDIDVYGTVIKEKMKSVRKYIDSNNKGTLLKIENKLLSQNYINTYADGLVNLMKMKESRVTAKGYINPQIQLGDIVTMVGSTIGIKGFYKVVGLEFELGSSYSCTASLMRTISTEYNPDDILKDYRLAINKALSGAISDYLNCSTKTAIEKAICAKKLANTWSKLDKFFKRG